MARRLIPFVTRQTNPSRDTPTVTPVTLNERITPNIQVQRAPDPLRDSDFNTRPSRRQLAIQSLSPGLSLSILREGFVATADRPEYAHRVGFPQGGQLPMRTGRPNMKTAKTQAWGTIMTKAAEGRPAW